MNSVVNQDNHYSLQVYFNRIDGWMDGWMCENTCIYTIVVIPWCCIQCITPQGPWVKSLRDNCPEYKSEWAEHHNTTCTSSVDFYMVAEQAILVRQSRWATITHTAHIQVQQYADCLSRAVNNNGVTITSKWSTTSRRYSTRIDHNMHRYKMQPPHSQENMAPSKNGNTSSRRTWDWWTTSYHSC